MAGFAVLGRVQGLRVNLLKQAGKQASAMFVQCVYLGADQSMHAGV